MNELDKSFLKQINKDNIQSSLEIYEMYSPDKNKPNIPYFNNPVTGLVQAASSSISYLGSKNLTMGNFYYNQGRYERAIENYILNILDEKYSLIIDRRESMYGLARCYLRLGDISSSINYLHKASTFHNKDDRITNTHKEIFNELCSKIKDQFDDELSNIKNSLDLYEFINELLEDKSGWALALLIVELTIEMT
ncbi:MAG: tetratricopeptide repeat protein [Candidatus Heimdallarchaeota archaeon]|nr:tetratricopeptide repeat protein [Candidatus Heimdallarchaeota archaeon]